MVNNILENLLELSLKNRLKYSNISIDLHPVQYAFEFKTIGLTLPRRCGKTTAIREFIKNRADKCLVIVKNTYCKSEYQIDSCDVVSILETNRLIKSMHDTNKYQYIIFDDSIGSHMDVVVSDIYYSTVNTGNTMQTYIKIGT